MGSKGDDLRDKVAYQDKLIKDQAAKMIKLDHILRSFKDNMPKVAIIFTELN
jgi:hypothetical protein